MLVFDSLILKSSPNNDIQTMSL